MLYIIIDPCQNYPAQMMRYLAEHGFRAICVFTHHGALAAFQGHWRDEIGAPIADEYLMPEWPSLSELAAGITRDHREPIHGIIPWDEMNTLTGAILATELGLDWNSPQVMRCFRDKYLMKETLRRRSGLRVNHSRLVASLDEVHAFGEEVGRWPIVVKPSAGAGARSVVFATNEDELETAAVNVFHAASAEGRGDVLLEEYVGGKEYVVNGVVDGANRFLATDVWTYDKRDTASAKNIYFQTIKCSTTDPEFAPLDDYATAVLEVLGLRRAPVHMELKVDEEGPCLIEVGARFAGGNQPSLASALHDRSLFALAAYHYVSEGLLDYEDIDYARYDRLHARIVSGVQDRALERINEIHGLDEVRGLSSFSDFGFVHPLGFPLSATVDLYTRAYEVYLIHPDPEQIEGDAAKVRELIRYL